MKQTMEQTMGRITEENTLGEILALEEFCGHEHMVGFYQGEQARQTRKIRLSKLPIIYPDWKPEVMAEGLNYLRKKAQEAEIFRDIWKPEDIEQDPSKGRTGLIALPQRGKRFVLLCAGGGYESVCSMVEAFPVAKRLEELGYGSFILRYRVGEEGRAPRPMEDLAAAIRYLSEHQQELGIDMKDYAVAGFSAGGHLAASIGAESLQEIYAGLPKPRVLMLAYPVISMGEKTHLGSRKNFLGVEAADENVGCADTNDKHETEAKKKILTYSMEEQVTKDYPAVYLWQCDEDPEVSIWNSRMLAAALGANGVPCKYETFPGKSHGWGLADGTTAQGWLERAIEFWKECSMGGIHFDAIHHVAIIASDYKKSRHFYVDLLGFEVIRENYREERDDHKLDLKLGECELEIFGIPNSPARPNYPEACGLRHLAFRVSCIEDTVSKLNALGIETEPIRRDTYTDKKMTFFKDPDGLPLELHE